MCMWGGCGYEGVWLLNRESAKVTHRECLAMNAHTKPLPHLELREIVVDVQNVDGD